MAKCPTAALRRRRYRARTDQQPPALLQGSRQAQSWRVRLLQRPRPAPGFQTRMPSPLMVSPNPPKDTDGRREESGRGGEGATGEIAWVPFGVGRSADGLHRRTAAPMAVCESCDARDGERIRSRELSRTGLARVCGDLRLSGGWVGRRRCRQAGSGMARSRAKARLNFSAQGQRSGRCRVNRRAERVSRPAREKNRRRRVLVVAIRSPRPIRAVQRARLWAIVWTASQAPLAAKRPEGRWFSPTPYLRSRMAFSISAWRRWSASSSSNSPSRSVMKP